MCSRRLPLNIIVIMLVLGLVTGTLPSLAAVKKERKTAGPSTEEKITHVLNRLGYGARPGDIERVRQIGLEKYIEQQLNPERIQDREVEARLEKLNSLEMSPIELARAYPRPNQLKKKQAKQDKKLELNGQDLEQGARKKEPKNRMGKGLALNDLDPQEVKGLPREILFELSQDQLLRAVYSERQLNEVMVDFWMNHFNVFWGKGADRYLLTSYMQDVIRPNAMGSFQKLLESTAQSPAMLIYLDNWMSIDPQAGERIAAERETLRERRLARRNRFGRFSNGPFGNEGVPRREVQPEKVAKGKKRTGLNENYARELMELHTLGVDGGYTQKDVTEVARCFTGWSIKRDGDDVNFSFYERLHDPGEKTVLGVKIPAGGGKRDGERVLEILMHNPSTAHFIATKLVRRFVADNPPEALVKRVATVFNKTNGDIREMLRAIFTSPEFYSPESYNAKVKSPLTLVVSALRAVDADTNISPQILDYLRKMGQPLFLCEPPTGYGDTAEKWVNTNALVERLNFAIALCEGRIRGTTPRLLGSSSAPTSLDRTIELLMRRSIGEGTRQALEKETGGKELTPEKLPRVAGLLLGSPEFQKM